jgi:peptide/nickel transport system substrate-binding protein
MVKKLLAILLVCCLLVSVTACGGNSNEPAPSTGDDSKDTASTDTTDTTDTKDDGNAETSTKDTVVVACAAEPDCFFPYHSTLGTNMDEVPILHNVYETPIKLGADGSHEPLIAKSWEISDDGLHYTLHLRDDVYFHNGEKMTAEDVAFSLNLGGNSVAGAAQLANYDNCEVIDENTVVVHLTAPYAPFLNALCGRYALIIDKSLYEEIGEDAYNDAPVGTGPYKFMDRVSGDRITLEAFADYWAGQASIKNVVYKVLTDVNTQMISLENGEIDVLIQANVGDLTKLATDKVKWEVVDASSICNLYLNCSEGPSADINFRKALQAGINKEEINIGVYEGYATVGDIQLPFSFSGRPEKGTYDVVEYDLEKAKEYLAKSNYNGEEFKIITVSGTRNETAAQIVQGQLIELGINCTVNALDTASYYAAEEAGEYGGKIRAGGISVLDADGMFHQYHTDHVVTGGKFNAGVSSDKLDELLEKGRVEVDANKRKEIYREAVNHITENAFCITLYYEANACAYSADLNGVVPRSLTGLYFFNDWSW